VPVLFVASLLTVLGFSAAPFAIADSSVNAALIAGFFSTINIVLNGLVLRRAGRNAELTRDVKRKVAGERRRPGERRRGDRRGDDD
jgi:hypothetical protein